MAGNYAGLALGRIILQFVAKTDEVDAALRNTHKGISELAVGMAKAGTSFLAFGATANQVFERLAQPLKQSISLAAELTTTLNAVTNIMDQKGLDGANQYRNALKDLSRTMGVDLVDAIKAFRALVESGISDKAAVVTLQKSAELSRVSMVSLDTALDAVRTSIKAFGYEMGNAEQQITSLNDVTYKLFQGFNFAAGSSEDFQKAIAKTSGVAALAGIHLDDFVAATAALTRVGVPSERAATSLTNAILSFLKPTQKAKDEVEGLNKQLGLTGDGALELSGKFLAKNGLIGSLEKFAQAAGYSADELANIFTRKGAIVSVFGLMADKFVDAHLAMEAMVDSSSGIKVQFEQMIDPTYRMNQAMAQFQSMSDSLGKSALPLVSGALENITPLLEKFNLSLEQTPAALSLVSGALGIFVLAGQGLAKFAINLGFLSFGLIAFKGLLNSLVKNPAMILFHHLFTTIADDLGLLSKELKGTGEVVEELAEPLSKSQRFLKFFREAWQGAATAIGKFVNQAVLMKAEWQALNLEAAFRANSAAAIQMSKDMDVARKAGSAFASQFALDNATLTTGAKAVLKVLMDMGKAFKAVSNIANPVGAGPRASADIFNTFIKGSAKATTAIRDLEGEIALLIGRTTGSSTAFRDMVPVLDGIINTFNQLRIAYASTSGNVALAFADFMDELSIAKIRAPQALREIQDAIRAVGATAIDVNAMLRPFMEAIGKLSAERGSLLGVAAALEDVMHSLGQFSGSGGGAEAANLEWITKLGMVADDSKLANFWTVLVRVVGDASVVIEKTLTSLSLRIGRFSVLATADFVKWNVAIDAVIQVFGILKESVGLVFDLMGAERGFNKVAEDTRRMVFQLGTYNQELDRNTLSIIKNAEENARWAQVMKSLATGIDYVLRALENFGTTAKIAFSYVAESAVKALDAVGDIVTWLTNKALGTNYDFTLFDPLIKGLQKFREEAAAFIQGQPTEWNITKQLEDYIDKQNLVIANYDDVRAALKKWVDEAKAFYESGQASTGIQDVAARKEQIKQEVAAFTAMYDQTQSLQSEETTKRLKEFETQAFNRKRQLEVELAMFNDYYDSLKKNEQTLQSELSKAIDYRDQLLLSSQFADNPNQFNWLQNELNGVQQYIDALRGGIGDIKRETLDTELNVTKQMTEDWGEAATAVTDDADAMAESIMKAGEEAAAAAVRFEWLFQKLTEGLPDAEKAKIHEILTSVQDTNGKLFEYLIKWAEDAGTQSIAKLVTGMLNQWNADGGKISQTLIEGIKNELKVTTADLEKFAEEQAWANSPLGHFFDGAITEMSKNAQQKIQEEVPKIKATFVQAVKDEFASIDWSTVLGDVTKAILNPGLTLDSILSQSKNGTAPSAPATGIPNGQAASTTGTPDGQSWWDWITNTGSQQAQQLGVGLSEYSSQSVGNMFTYPDLASFAADIVSGNLPQYGYLYDDAEFYLNNGYAKGGQSHKGGMALVGEEGPELVELPAGSKVKTAQETGGILRNWKGKKRIPAYAGGTDNPGYVGYVGTQGTVNRTLPSELQAAAQAYLLSQGMQIGTAQYSAAFWYLVQHPKELKAAIIKQQAMIYYGQEESPYYGSFPSGYRAPTGPIPETPQGPFFSTAESNYNPGSPNVNWLDRSNPTQPMQNVNAIGSDVRSSAAGRLNPYASTVDYGYGTDTTNYNADGGEKQNWSGQDTNALVNFAYARQFLYEGTGPIADAIKNGMVSYPQVMAALYRSFPNLFRGRRTPASSLTLGSPVFAGSMGMTGANGGNYNLNVGQGDYTLIQSSVLDRNGNRASATDQSRYSHYTGYTPDRTVYFVGDLEGMAKSGRFRGIPEFDQALGLWRQMGGIAQKYGFSTTYLAQNSSVGSYGVDTKPSRVSDADVIAFQALYKQVLALLGKAQDAVNDPNRAATGPNIPIVQQKGATSYVTSGSASRYGSKDMPTLMSSGGNGATYGASAASMFDTVGIPRDPDALHEYIQQLMASHRVRAMAKGGMSSGGAYLVGEQGPELVDIPGGARVTSARQTQSRLNFTAYGSGGRGLSGSSGGSRAPVRSKRTTGSDLLMKLEAELRVSTLSKIRAFLGSIMGSRGTDIADFKDWSVNDLVDHIMNSVVAQSGMAPGSLYSAWKRVGMESGSSSFDEFNNPERDWSKPPPQTFSGGRRSFSGGKSGGGGGWAAPGPGQPGEYGTVGGRGRNGGIWAPGPRGPSSPGSPRSPREPAPRGTDPPRSKTGKERPDSESGHLSAARRQLIDNIPGMSIDALERLLQLLIGVSEAEGIMSSDPSKAKLVDYIINDVIRGKNIPTDTLQSYVTRANKPIAKPPKPPYTPKPRTKPQRPGSRSNGGGSMAPSSPGVYALAGTVQSDNSNTQAVQQAMSSAVSYGDGSGLGTVQQNFHVGQVRTDDDIARIAMASQARIVRTRRRAE